jgi:hypothetical protein
MRLKSTGLNIKGNLNVTGNVTANGIYKIGNQNGINGNFTILKDVDLIGLTKTYCNLNFSGGILVGSSC